MGDVEEEVRNGGRQRRDQGRSDQCSLWPRCGDEEEDSLPKTQATHVPDEVLVIRGQQINPMEPEAREGSEESGRVERCPQPEEARRHGKNEQSDAQGSLRVAPTGNEC